MTHEGTTVRRVGITGHVDVSEENARWIIDALTLRLQDAVGQGWQGITCLARGADQLFAKAVLALKGSYDVNVDESNGVGTVGTPLEEGYWEEFGTGEHADTAANGGKLGRQGWWVYVKGQGPSAKVSAEYRDKDEAEAVAASMRADGLDAYATNGRDPHYTLEHAFEAKAEWLEKRFAKELKERME
jgi:hypothetical protein